MTTANQAEYDAWNGDSGRRWATDPDRRDGVLRNIAAALLEAADLTVGDAVVDLGCGCGATALVAARAVGPDGAVLGVDLSEPMLDVARQRVAAARLPNVALLQADAQTHPLDPGAHAIGISRFGTMFFDDPVAAFSNIASGIRRGGRLCIATWQPLVANDWLTIPGTALLRYGSLPEPVGTAPGMFAQSDPDIVTGVLERSGFCDVDVQATTVPLRLGADPGEAAAYLADTGVGRAVLATIPDDDHTAALDAVRAVLAEHLDADGVQLDGGVLLTGATRV